MTPKPPSPAALRRRIERLEAELEALRETNRKLHEVYQVMLYEAVEFKIRAQQAIKILKGEDDARD